MKHTDDLKNNIGTNAMNEKQDSNNKTNLKEKALEQNLPKDSYKKARHKRKFDELQRITIITIITLIINVVLVLSNLFLVHNATISNNIAKKSLDEVQETIQNQRNAIKESKHQFEILNASFLSLTNSEIEVAKAGKPLQTRLKVENLGRYPCKIVSCKIITSVRISPPAFAEIYRVAPDYTDIINKYILHDNPLPSSFRTRQILNLRQEKLIKNTTNYFVYLTGFIKYKDLITNNIKMYGFQLKMKPGYETQYVINKDSI